MKGLNEIRVPFLESFPLTPHQLNFSLSLCFSSKRKGGRVRFFVCRQSKQHQKRVEWSEPKRKERGKEREREDGERKDPSLLFLQSLLLLLMYFSCSTPKADTCSTVALVLMPLHDFPLYPGVRRIKGTSGFCWLVWNLYDVIFEKLRHLSPAL